MRPGMQRQRTPKLPPYHTMTLMQGTRLLVHSGNFMVSYNEQWTQYFHPSKNAFSKVTPLTQMQVATWRPRSATRDNL